MAKLIESKCTNVVGAGCTVIPDARMEGNNVCTNARASVVEKQIGADPTLPVCWLSSLVCHFFGQNYPSLASKMSFCFFPLSPSF
jgi:hypothetical protein